MFLNLFFNWRIIALKNFVVFCQISTWISHRCAHVPSLLKHCAQCFTRNSSLSPHKYTERSITTAIYCHFTDEQIKVQRSEKHLSNITSQAGSQWINPEASVNSTAFIPALPPHPWDSETMSLVRCDYVMCKPLQVTAINTRAASHTNTITHPSMIYQLCDNICLRLLLIVQPRVTH